MGCAEDLAATVEVAALDRTIVASQTDVQDYGVVLAAPRSGPPGGAVDVGLRVCSRPSARAAVSTLSRVVTTMSAPAAASRSESSARAIPIAAMPPALAAST